MPDLEYVAVKLCASEHFKNVALRLLARVSGHKQRRIAEIKTHNDTVIVFVAVVLDRTENLHFQIAVFAERVGSSLKRIYYVDPLADDGLAQLAERLGLLNAFVRINKDLSDLVFVNYRLTAADVVLVRVRENNVIELGYAKTVKI